MTINEKNTLYNAICDTNETIKLLEQFKDLATYDDVRSGFVRDKKEAEEMYRLFGFAKALEMLRKVKDELEEMKKNDDLQRRRRRMKED